MFKGKKIIWLGLFLVALFAPTAQAVETILVDPGTVGESAQPMSFSVTVPSTGQVDLVFNDNKTLTFGPGEQKFRLAFLTGQGFAYDGVLLDEFGNELPGTEFAGVANVSDANLSLGASTVWSGMRFNGVFFLGAYQLVWIPQLNGALPEVGDTTGNKPPNADAGGPYSGVLFAPVTFDGSASFDPDGGDIAQYDWDFGDDTTLTDGGPTPSHTYTFQANTYLVTLTVTDEDGATDSGSTSVAISATSAPPVADAGGPYEGTTGAAVTFDGTDSSDPDGGNLSYDWTFGDLSVGSGPTPTHTYTEDGKYVVGLTVTDDSGEEAQDGTVATIGSGNLPPSADAGAPVTGVVGVAVSFDGSASDDPDGTIAQYDWDFGDGGTGTSPNPTISHTYDTAGIYTVMLTVTDDGGTSASSFTSADIAENNQPPVADANGPYSGDVGVAVDFDGSGSSDQDGTILAQVWDFGDGETGVGATVSHAYAVAGEYDVVLTVIDEDGGIGEDKTTATIGSDNQPPVADANGPYAGIVDTPVSFDGTASDDPDGNEIATYAWDFGDGTLGSGSQPQHSYLETGVYDVTLTVTDVDGGTDVSVTKAIIGDGNLPPVADAGGPYRGRVNVAVTFDGSASSDPDGNVATYEWDFGDGTQGGSETMNHSYTTAGFYHVTLTVTDNNGIASSDNTLVEIGTTSVPPLADAGGPYTGTPNSVINFDGNGSSDTDGNIATWAWDFGDGTFGDGATTQKTYTATGTYPVILTVTDNTGETDIDLTTALIGEGSLPPVADAGGPYGGAVGAIVSFDGTGSSDPGGSGIASYTWDFGDGSTATGPTPTHAYSEAGNYVVTLTVTDDEGVPASNGTLANIGPLDLSGTVTDAGGTPLCSLVLASGQFMFSCNPNGPFSLTDLPREADGSVKRQVYVDGFFPNIRTLQASVTETVVMTRAGTCPDYNTFPDPGVFPESAGKRIDVSGTVLLQNSDTPVCAMVLANGQFDFTCDGTGSYAGNIPLDANGQYKLQVYAEGFAPLTQRFDEFSPNVEVRLARAAECQ